MEWRRLALDVGGAQARGQHVGDGLLDQVRRLSEAEGIAQRHAERADHGDRIGDSLAGDVGRRAVDGLIHRLALAIGVGRAERGRRQHAQRAGEHGGHVRQHVAEQIVGDDHVELLGPAHELHAERVGEHVLELDVRIGLLVQLR